MTEPVTFGDLLDQARRHLDAADRIPGRVGNEQDLLDATRGMREVITAISQYFRDILTGYPKKPDRRRRVESRAPESVVHWAAAFLQARRAAANAVRYLEPATVLRPTGTFATERGQHLNTAALALVAGRDLLHMHAVTRSDGKREERSSWAPVIDALIFRQAVAAEIAAVARQAAAVGTAFVTAPMIPWDQTTDSRKGCGSRSITSAVTWVATNGTRICTGASLPSVISGPAVRRTLTPSADSWPARYPASPGLASVSVISARVTAAPSP